MTEKEFIAFLNENNITYTQNMLDKLIKYKELLKEYNQKYNLKEILTFLNKF